MIKVVKELEGLAVVRFRADAVLFAYDCSKMSTLAPGSRFRSLVAENLKKRRWILPALLRQCSHHSACHREAVGAGGRDHRRALSSRPAIFGASPRVHFVHPARGTPVILSVSSTVLFGIR